MHSLTSHFQENDILSEIEKERSSWPVITSKKQA